MWTTPHTRPAPPITVAITISALCLVTGLGCQPAATPTTPTAPASTAANDQPATGSTTVGAAAKPANSSRATPPPALVEGVDYAYTSGPDESEPFTLETGFRSLSYAAFTAIAAEPTTWEETPAGLRCSGAPRGYLYTTAVFRDLTLRLSYRFPKPLQPIERLDERCNTGFLLFINPPHKVWPACLEVQGKFSQLGMLKENGGFPRPEIVDHEAVRLEARKPIGHWNQLEITAAAGKLRVRLNSIVVAEGQVPPETQGALGIQSEGYPFEIRHLRIQTGAEAPLPPSTNPEQ